MSNHETMIALLEKLGAVEWEEDGRLYQLYLPDPKSRKWQVRYCWRGTWFHNGNRTNHEAECLMIRETYRRLLDKWDSVDTLRHRKSVTVTLYSPNNHKSYKGPTELDAVLASAIGEL